MNIYIYIYLRDTTNNCLLSEKWTLRAYDDSHRNCLRNSNNITPWLYYMVPYGWWDCLRDPLSGAWLRLSGNLWTRHISRITNWRGRLIELHYIIMLWWTRWCMICFVINQTEPYLYTTVWPHSQDGHRDISDLYILITHFTSTMLLL